jgi:hypothetical protein
MINRRFAVRLTGLLGLMIFLAGCATSGKTFSETSATFSAPAPGNGRIYLYRTAIFGAAIQPSVTVNDVVVGSAVARGFFYVDRPAGDYRISASTEVTRTLSLSLAQGQVRYVRLAMGLGFFVGHVIPELVEDSEAIPQIGSCHLISS